MQKISYFFIKCFILIALISPSFIFADDKSKLFLLPRDKDIALKTLYKNIDLAKNDIKISIYTFTHKKIAKRLKKAAARGVNIEIIFDKKESKSKSGKSMITYLAKYKNVKTYKLKGLRSKNKKYSGIMHIKMAVIDSKTLIFGSANWTYSAFSKNYETLFITKDYQKAKKFLEFFAIQKSKSKLYR
jgi:phosphatidylserine/phosphatidylglycerophosphate/cardiolipin synthase-like enzyme